MEAVQRIKKVVNWLIYTDIAENERGVADLLGYSKSSFSQITNGKVPLSDKFISKLCALDCNLNATWIKTGDGSMLRTEDITPSPTTDELDIKGLRSKLGVTQKKLAEMVGVSTNTIQNWESGTTIPKSKHQILGRLLSGENPIVNTEEAASPPMRDYDLVPLINIDSVGGVHSENMLTPSEQYIIKTIPFSDARKGDVAIFQSGNSMYPTIPSGSVLLIREVVDWREYLGYGNIYVLWLRDGRRITKEVRRYDADPQNYVWCVSYNPNVADEELPRSLIVGVWKVVKYVADFGW